MPAERSKHSYIVVEYETQTTWDTVAEALEVAKTAHENDRTRGYAVAELVATVGSEHKTIVTRVK